MPGRKRKLPSDYVPQGWLEPGSDEDGEWQPMTSYHAILAKRRKEGSSVHDHSSAGPSAPGPEHEPDQEESDDRQEPTSPAIPSPPSAIFIEEEEAMEEDEAVQEDPVQEEVQLVQSPPAAASSQEEADESVEEEVQLLQSPPAAASLEEEADEAREEELQQVQSPPAEDEAIAEEDDEEEEEEEDDEDIDLGDGTYKSIFEKLTDRWLLTEVDHHCSKTSTNEFWRVANKYFAKLYAAKEREGITRKTPLFSHIRKQIHDKRVPRISMEVAYQHKTTGEISVAADVDATPTSQYPPNVYTKIYESASIEVIYPSVHLSVKVPSVSPSVRPSVSLSVRPSVRPSVCLSV